ncbi:hypothetical protein MMC26_006921 [Xylographa opegraphella]|nr:hypothetical protein [Xylographa opegraphella]
MALLLAPYNEAMRLGMGYTQQLCVNDVVRRPGGLRASEKDLRSVDTTKGLSVRGSAEEPGVLSQPSGTVVKRNGEGGQADVSALTITCAAIGGGGEANAHFVDSTKFIQSDARYSILVKVTNQKLVADDVTEFTPISNVPASQFNDVYGDCFISGFMEGGVLSALVLKSLVDQNDKKVIGGGLNINVDVKVATVKGEAAGKKVDEKKEKHELTTITISWSGGGDIKPNDIKEWDIPTLTKVAMEFPDKVALCPQRTYAILTKYSSLHYEIAGIYTSSLLDSYTEYKAMWAELNEAIKEVDRGTSKLRRREGSEKLSSYGNLVKADYDTRMVKYNKIKTAIERSTEFNGQITLEEPLPPNEVEPYPADSFGLDKAARDCRFEMIKIVREVNEVTADPKVATDPYRNWRYLSPHVFRLLVPADKEHLPSIEEIAKMKSDLEAKIQDRKERDALKDTNLSLEKQLSDQHEKHGVDTQQSAASEAKEKELIDKLNEKDNALKEGNAKFEEMQKSIETQAAAATDSSKRITELEGKYAEAKQAESNIRERVTQAEQGLQAARSEAEQARRERDSIRAGSDDGPDLAIYNITWGGRQLLGEASAEAQIRQFAQGCWGFTYSNDFFGCDPKPGQRKDGMIVYRKRGGRVVVLTGSESSQSAFQ